MVRKITLQLMTFMALGTFAGALYLSGATGVAAQPAGGQANGAQDAPRPAPPRPPRTEELVKALGLNAQQATAVQGTLGAERDAMRALDEATRPQRDAIHAETRKKLAAALTAEQLKRYDDWREANRPPRPEGAGSRQADAPSNTRRNPTR